MAMPGSSHREDRNAVTLKYVCPLVVLASVAAAGRCAENASPPADPLGAIATRLKVHGVAVPRLAEALKAERPPDFSKWAGPLAFGRLDGAAGRTVPVRTDGYLACDASHLHLAIRCFEDNVSAVPARKAAHDGNVWAGDNVEMMILPGLDPTKPYFQFALNPAGSVFDARITDTSWNGSAITYAWREAKSWTVAASVPFEAMGVRTGAVPALWRVNLHRWRPERGRVKSLDLSWSPTNSRSNHVPSRFAVVHLAGLGKAIDAAAARRFLDESEKLQVLFRQDFSKDTEGFDAGEVVKAEEAGGTSSFLRCKGRRKINLQRNFGDIHGLRMALAYRTAPHQHGLVIHGQGTVVRAARPGCVEVLGRGLKVARRTCRDADGASRAVSLGFDAFLFKRPYGH
jgi:hypothetical protein